MTSLRRALLTVLVAACVGTALAGCSSASRSATSTTSSTSTTEPGGATTSTTTPPPGAVVFTTVDGAIDAYLSVPPYTRQRVAAAGTAPDGNLPHGQICFSPDGSRRFVVAESKPAGTTPASAGWGLYQLTGDGVGTFAVRRVSGFTSPSDVSSGAPTTYGCAFLADGRLLTTDVGNARDGSPTGRLVEWFPPFDGGSPASCVVASSLATPLGLSADSAENVYLASARAPTAGVWRYSGTFPTTTAGCVTATVGPAAPNTTSTTEPSTPPSTAPSTTVPAAPAAPAAVTATLIIAPDPGPASAPTAVAVTATDDGLVVSSAPYGSIIAYDLSGAGATPVLSDPSGTMVGPAPLAGGTPLGIVVGPDDTIYYADPGLVRDGTGVIAPADRTGSLRRIAPSPGETSPPQPDTMNANLSAPDGVGLYLGPTQGGGASIA